MKRLFSGLQRDQVTLVDTPGVRDLAERGYDYPGVLGWFAERADLVLLVTESARAWSYH